MCFQLSRETASVLLEQSRDVIESNVETKVVLNAVEASERLVYKSKLMPPISVTSRIAFSGPCSGYTT